MKTIFKIILCALSFFWMITSCSKDDLPILEISDYTTTVNENLTNNQLIGTIPSAVNSNRELYYATEIISQSVANAILISNGGYYSTENLSVYVNDVSAFDFELHPVITATVKVKAVSYKLDFSQEIHDSKTITITINLKDLPE